MQLVHASICGPITPKSNNHKRYLITFIDDYNRNLWSKVLNLKSKALIELKSFKSLIEKETGKLYVIFELIKEESLPLYNLISIVAQMVFLNSLPLPTPHNKMGL